MGQNELMANGLTPFLLGLAALVCVFDLVRSKFWATVESGALQTQLKPLLTVFGALAALGATGFFLHLELLQALPFALGGAVAVYLTNVIDPAKHRHMRTTFLLAVSSLLVLNGGEHFVLNAAAYVCGMLLLKVVQNFAAQAGDKVRLDDIAASSAYLAGMALVASQGGTPTGKNADIITGAFAVATLLNLMQRPFMHDDKLLVKRLVLTISGGLGMLVVLTKALTLISFTNLAAVVGGGFGLMYALDAFGRMAQDPKYDDSERAGKYLKSLLLVGIFTLLSTRLFGNVGMAALAACVVVGTFSQLPACAALFFAARLFEQAFANLYVSNVTGVNLQHSYVSAAQYLGFFVIVGVLVLIKASRQGRVDAAALAVIGTLGAGLTSFFLHAEPTASYLVALAVAGIVASILLQGYFAKEKEENRCLSVMLLPVLSSAFALLSGGLVEQGLHASMQDRLNVIGGLAGLTVLLMLVQGLANKKSGGNSGPDTVAVSGD
jgi:hypothetical protein